MEKRRSHAFRARVQESRRVQQPGQKAAAHGVGNAHRRGMSARGRYLGFWSVSREELEMGTRGQKGVVLLWG